MTTHDARTVAATLRDHLASHDRPVSFLFGAGTSSAVNTAASGFTPLIPAIALLTAECKGVVDALSPAHAAAWTQLVAECTSLGVDPNIEGILSRIRAKLEALAPGRSVDGLTRDEWQRADDEVRSRIALLANPAIPKDLPHHHFARWVRNTSRRVPIEVFTTNYDILFEKTFDELSVPHFDGFIGSQHTYFSSDAVENDALLPSAGWARLWKLHGSVTWTFEDVRGRRRITRGRPSSSGELVLPSHRKYDESRKEPYRALMDRFTRVLRREDALLITSGFSFSDQHINAIVLDALDHHPRTHVIVLSYNAISDTEPISMWAKERPNILHIGPNAAVISGRFGEWDGPATPDPTTLTKVTGGLAIADPADAAKVKVLAGDFNAFCAFLQALGGVA